MSAQPILTQRRPIARAFFVARLEATTATLHLARLARGANWIYGERPSDPVILLSALGLFVGVTAIQATIIQ